MKCVKCGAELKEGCIYCSVCGHESQILPDYNALEDDYLRSLLNEEIGTPPENHEKKLKPKKKSSGGRKPKKSVIVSVVAILLLAAMIAGMALKMSIDEKNANSYDYQVAMAEKELVDLNYEKALGYYKTALSLRPDDIAVRMAMADIYMGQKDDNSAMVLLIEVVELDEKNKEAYKQLIALYEKRKDYNSIKELASGITDTAILELFEGYIVAPPVMSMDAGKYIEPIVVTLFSVDEDEIYYTMDGSIPDAENGMLYDGKEIRYDKNGIYELKAVARNAKGIFSDVASVTYRIELAPPKYPIVTPDGGRITEEVLVTIEAEDDCSVYYTWDGTDPTTMSEKYEIPLVIPDGNNILSVLVVDEETGLDSGVYRTNFIYYR